MENYSIHEKGLQFANMNFKETKCMFMQMILFSAENSIQFEPQRENADNRYNCDC